MSGLGQSERWDGKTVEEVRDEWMRRAKERLNRIIELEAERDRYLTTLDAIRLEAEACADVNEPVGSGWLISTCEEAIQGV